jgi:hypothetical protein
MSTSGKNMNCDEYKEAIAADPSFSDDAGHVAACPSCAQFKANMLALDERIASALAIDVPALQIPDLPMVSATEDKVVSLESHRKQRFAMPTWIGIAAGFALAAIVGVQFLASDGLSDQELAAEILAHVDHEPWSIEVTDVAVTNERITDVMAVNGGTMHGSIGLVSYAQSCIINGKQIPHLVIQGKNGPVTVLLMPEEMVSMPIRLDGKGISGIILPVGDGSIALVGERDFDVDELKERVVNSVEWST